MSKKEKIDWESDDYKIQPMRFEDVLAEHLKDPEIKRRFDALEWKYKLIEALIDERSKKGYSQEKLAKKIGTKQSAIARFESGRGNPTVDFIERLSKALGLTLNITVK